ncbi:MAG: hypothetical protein FJZ90_00830 [Chloroflexi bacterium]|nr:hypothetical protein [Chloroflexota bacterium]
MSRSFARGVLTGALAPVAFVAGTVYWIYRFTRKVPFPVRRAQEGELVVGLVDPQEVPAYWQRWRAELEPLWARVQAVTRELKESYRLPE